MVDSELEAAARRALAACRARHEMAATAESCTGGLIAGALTAIAGSSDVLDCGVVTYSNAAKAALLGVPKATLARDGAVSEATARAMAEGMLARSQAGVAVAVTGIAGPGGGSAGKPVGLVWFGLARRGEATRAECQRFAGDRSEVRRATVLRALALLAG